jgi:hypothetical protein
VNKTTTNNREHLTLRTYQSLADLYGQTNLLEHVWVDRLFGGMIRAYQRAEAHCWPRV